MRAFAMAVMLADRLCGRDAVAKKAAQIGKRRLKGRWTGLTGKFGLHRRRLVKE